MLRERISKNQYFFCRKTSSVRTMNSFQRKSSKLYFRSLLKFDNLKSELEYLEENDRHDHSSFTNRLFLRTFSTNEENLNDTSRYSQLRSTRKLKKHRSRKLNDLKLALSEFYLMLILLKNYQSLNYDGFCKILKKHDKLFQMTTGSQWR